MRLFQSAEAAGGKAVKRENTRNRSKLERELRSGAHQKFRNWLPDCRQVKEWMEKAGYEGAFFSRWASIFVLAKIIRTSYLKREPRNCLAGQNRGWHGAVSAPVSDYHLGCLTFTTSAHLTSFEPRSTVTWPCRPVTGSGSGRRARREVVSAWLCPPYPFAPCRRIVQRQGNRMNAVTI